MALPPRRVFNTPFVPVEASADSSESMRLAYENFIDDRPTDPFDILAELEEELGHPIYFS